jgi:parallel beta-helix repeat protein
MALGLNGGAAGAADDLWVVVGGVRMVGTPIKSVPYTITAPGYYYLTANLTVSGSNSYGIVVNADNVTLNLMGYSLSYASTFWSVGVYMNGRSNVEVRNGTVRGFTQAGIMEGSTAGAKHRVINVRAVNNAGGLGIFLHGSGHLVENCTAANNRTGIWIDAGEITGCIAATNTSLGLWNHGPGSVLDNAVFNNTDNNFWLGNGVATSLLVDGNSAYGLGTNYGKPSGTTGVVITANNAGTP